ncbi:PAS domain-containing sensor histidine kinase, partial [Hymenobacter persicinus]
DITDRKQMEQDLRASKELLEAVFHATLDSVQVLQCVRDAAGVLLDFEWLLTNEAAHRLLQRLDVRGRRLLEEAPAMRTNGVLEQFRRVVEQQQPVNFELLYPKEGRETWYHIAAAPFGDGLVVTWHEITARKQATAELLHLQRAQQQALFNAVLEAQETERQRMADTLHNGVGQTLYAAKLQVDQLGAGPETRLRASALLTDAIRQIRTLSHELTPTVLVEFGLAAALSDIGRAFSSRGLRFQCFIDLDAEPPLPQPLELAIYRIAQELAQNVVKHARASEASLAVETVPGFVLLRVEDNGVGFASTPAPGAGIGLRTIRDRVALLGGTIDVGSTPAFGTYVRIRFPTPSASEQV